MKPCYNGTKVQGYDDSRIRQLRSTVILTGGGASLTRYPLPIHPKAMDLQSTETTTAHTHREMLRSNHGYLGFQRKPVPEREGVGLLINLLSGERKLPHYILKADQRLNTVGNFASCFYCFRAFTGFRQPILTSKDLQGRDRFCHLTNLLQTDQAWNHIQ